LASGSSVQELPDQTGLADAWVADDTDDLAVAWVAGPAVLGSSISGSRPTKS
jgi:hypothetical protein